LKFLKRLTLLFLAGFLLVNMVAFFHAYKFTHFTNSAVKRVKKNEASLTFSEKLNALVFGVNIPKPKNEQQPTQPFETIRLKSNKEIECWHIKADSAKGTVILFHGYGGAKGSMLDKSDAFLAMGYNTLVVDFMGSGGSEGVQSTIGYKESEQVKTCFEYVQQSGEKNIYLFGTSMGAAAVLKSLYDYEIHPTGIIVECPFGTMYETTCARFNNMGVPPFPMANILLFWGSVQNGFWTFSHNPADYAKSVKCPTLLLYGEKDAKVSRKETDEIFANITGIKTLKIYPEAGHENYLIRYRDQWVTDITGFFNSLSASSK
jgi:alpha-beta hydrolase superfamily lysophospholipase